MLQSPASELMKTRLLKTAKYMRESSQRHMVIRASRPSRGMDKAHRNGLMEPSTKENGCTTRWKERVK